MVNLTSSSSFFFFKVWKVDRGEVYFEEMYFFLFLTNESVAEFMWRRSEGGIWVGEIDARMNRTGWNSIYSNLLGNKRFM